MKSEPFTIRIVLYAQRRLANHTHPPTQPDVKAAKPGSVCDLLYPRFCLVVFFNFFISASMISVFLALFSVDYSHLIASTSTGLSQK